MELADRFVATLARQIEEPGFRGCPCINASAEYPDPGSRLYQEVVRHRTMVEEGLRRGLELFGNATPAETALLPTTLRDG
ncbi:MAG: hypothetical protein WKF81_10755, partial [Thermomicrobiales bacterium]